MCGALVHSLISHQGGKLNGFDLPTKARPKVTPPASTRWKDALTSCNGALQVSGPIRLSLASQRAVGVKSDAPNIGQSMGRIKPSSGGLECSSALPIAGRSLDSASHLTAARPYTVRSGGYVKVIYDAVLGVRIFGCPISGVRLLWRDLLPHNYTDNTVRGGSGSTTAIGLQWWEFAAKKGARILRRPMLQYTCWFGAVQGASMVKLVIYSNVFM